MKRKARCPEGGLELVRYLTRQRANRTSECATRFVCSRAIADSIGAELREFAFYPDGHTEPHGPGPSRRANRGEPYLRTGDMINGMRVEVLEQNPDYYVDGLAWVS